MPGAAQPAQIADALELDRGRWMNVPPANIAAMDRAARVERLAAIFASWADAVYLREARSADSGQPARPGLRRPQVGALHAALAHATRSTGPATIVMPTGTGKTETMLALNAHQRFERLLVVVPTDALREQIAGKFETFGVLRLQQCLADGAAFPLVMRLSHIPASPAEVDEIFDSANVVVTTMQIAGRAEAAVQEQLAARASALFIDEAHHIGAPTWARFRGLFIDRDPPLPIVQFTATPFREDGRRVDGEFIYTYPLKKAQAEGYFKPIRFEAVFGLDQPDADLAIAEKLGEVLQADLDAGLNHLAMARCQTIDRAKDLHQLCRCRLGGGDRVRAAGERLYAADRGRARRCNHSRQAGGEIFRSRIRRHLGQRGRCPGAERARFMGGFVLATGGAGESGAGKGRSAGRDRRHEGDRAEDAGPGAEDRIRALWRQQRPRAGLRRHRAGIETLGDRAGAVRDFERLLSKGSGVSAECQIC